MLKPSVLHLNDAVREAGFPKPRIEGEERRRELARMLSGKIDEASLTHASELLVNER